MSTSLGLIWSLLNTLQIIVLIPLINLSFPMNTVKLSVILMTIANFDIIPHSWFNSVVFNFKDSNVFTEARISKLGFLKLQLYLELWNYFLVYYWLVFLRFGYKNSIKINKERRKI